MNVFGALCGTCGCPDVGLGVAAPDVAGGSCHLHVSLGKMLNKVRRAPWACRLIAALLQWY